MEFIKRAWLVITPLVSAVSVPLMQILPSFLRQRKILVAQVSSYSLNSTNDVIKCPNQHFERSCQEPVGLLSTEANCGDLQRYLDGQNQLISDDLRLRCRLQAAEAIAYIHSKDVIHSDLRPENCLLHIYNGREGPDLLLSDFGGSYCKTSDRTIDGNHLPDTGFFNPTKEWISTKDTDMFALGSVFYTIMTGHWPYKSAGPFVSVEEQGQYDETINELFTKKEYPPVEDLIGGDIIHDCWLENLKDAGAIVSRHKILIQKREQFRRGHVELAHSLLTENNRILYFYRYWLGP
ncbi:hypothetical protein E4T39_06473 [Aureobasidium subglaciale]|nr:hypothetical protein E4T39_06473 [Aureobasidium subglaciale]